MAPYIKTQFINLCTDFGFKRLFASEERKHILIRFLNALLGDSMTVTDVELRNPEQQPDSPEGKRIIYDVFFRSSVEFGDKGEAAWMERHRRVARSLGREGSECLSHHFILEMQNLNQPPFEERLLYYSAREISEQGRAGAAYLLNR